MWDPGVCITDLETIRFENIVRRRNTGSNEIYTDSLSVEQALVVPVVAQ